MREIITLTGLVFDVLGALGMIDSKEQKLIGKVIEKGPMALEALKGMIGGRVTVDQMIKAIEEMPPPYQRRTHEASNEEADN